ncbi:hypothetical protein EJ02DRAFT_353573 [Clathrospora elynae]|uniref:Uncharacterized protein n=1 Tax=Clathrospora elynae TaxID=706981 RepID=A0A6A5SH07_9PLEO|nr:hypothetical protein EJ02DRAFT_353573 [Clathrospora elynae]
MSDFSGFSFEPLPKPARYYAQTLSVPDKHALTTGEKNQNFKSWTPKDAVMHHEARKDLVPRVMPKADKTNALAGIEHDKQKSAQAFSRMTIKKEEDEGEATYEQPHQQLASKSTTDLRSSSAPAPKLLATLPVSPHMVDEEMAPPRSSQHARAASSGDYFSHNPPGRVPGRRPVRHTRGHSPLASSSAPSSDTSNHRVRSPLTQEVPQHQHNPRVTFDAFLAPHKSGKGEAFHDTANAKKKPEGSPKSARSRLGRMSMPLLRRRGGLEEE